MRGHKVQTTERGGGFIAFCEVEHEGEIRMCAATGPHPSRSAARAALEHDTFAQKNAPAGQGEGEIQGTNIQEGTESMTESTAPTGIAREVQESRDAFVARHPEILEQMPPWASDYIVDLDFTGAGDDALVLYVRRGQYGILTLAGLVTNGVVEFAENDPAHFAAHDQDVPLDEFSAFAAEVTSLAEIVEAK